MVDARRSSSCSLGDFKVSVNLATSARSAAKARNASMPTSASTRRAPEPTDDSPIREIIPI